MEKGRRLFYTHAGQVGRIAADGLGMTDDEFAEHAAATNERLLFTVNAFQAATRTVSEAKLQALGRVLRDGLSDEARLAGRGRAVQHHWQGSGGSTTRQADAAGRWASRYGLAQTGAL
jgi:hypothetical protein